MIQISKPVITDKDIKDVVAILKSGMLVQGPKVKKLEESFAKYCGTKHAVAFNSGTAALHAALYAMEAKEGDEVITTPFTFVATANSILMQNAKVKFVDIDEKTFNISPQAIEKAITKKTKVILPVSLYGLAYDQSINSIAKKHKIKVLDDACQAIGGSYKTKKVGNLADITAFSLYATKNIMSVEGGMITTNNATYAEQCRRLRHHGQSEKTRYQYFDIGYNYRMSDLHAVIGINQLASLEKFTKQRIKNAKQLGESLGNIKGITVPETPTNYRHVFHQFTIRVGKDFKLSRDQLRSKLADNGVGSGVYYPKPLHMHKHFQKMGYKQGDFPVSEMISKEVLSLPVHPSLNSKDIGKIIKVINSLAK
jgi:perosamine synthetase